VYDSVAQLYSARLESITGPPDGAPALYCAIRRGMMGIARLFRVCEELQRAGRMFNCGFAPRIDICENMS
jgi:hypothetical protein